MILDKKMEQKIYYIFFYGLLVIMLFPYIKTGYMGDDILNSLIKGDSINGSRNIIMTIIFYLGDSIKKGRINFVFWIYYYLLFYFVTNKMYYKIWIIFLTVVSIYCAEKFIAFFFDSKKIGRIFGGICIGLFPFYVPGANSIEMYVGYMQIEVILLFEMLSALILYCNNKRKRNLVYSYALYTLSLFVYEISYIFVIPILFILWNNAKTDYQEKKKILKVYLLIFCVCCLIVIAIKSIGKIWYSNLNYNGISVSFDARMMLETFITQFIGAVPILNMCKELPIEGTITFQTIALSIAFLVFFLVIIKKNYFKVEIDDSDNLKKRIFVLVISFLLLWLGCSGLISITQKYQMEINFVGYPHIPVYVEYFCFSILVFCLMLYIKRRWSKRIVLCIVGLSILVNCSIGELSIQNHVNATSLLYTEMPELYISALNNGLCEKITEKDVIVIDNSYSPTIYPNLFAQCMGRKIKSERLDIFMKQIKCLERKDEKIYYPEKNLYITKSFVCDEQKVVYCDKVEFIIYDEDGGVKSIGISEINAYCESKEPIDNLPIIKNNEMVSEKIDECEVKKLKGNRYIINSSDGLYDYYSYTYWQ